MSAIKLPSTPSHIGEVERLSGYLVVQQYQRQGSKTDAWGVWGLREGADRTGAKPLGVVSFWSPRRCYVFHPQADTLYNADCMRDLAHFCNVQTQIWRAEVKARRS